jgi:PAS domain S-box-containing protein
MAIVGLDDRFLQVNQALCDILGYTRAELLATTVAAITHPDDRQIEATYRTTMHDSQIETFRWKTLSACRRSSGLGPVECFPRER